MRRLKIILQSNRFYIILFLLLASVCIVFYSLDNYNSIYQDNEHIAGYVADYKKKGDKTTILLKGKENLIVNYYKEIDVRYGDIIEVDGLLYEPMNNTIPNTFNYKKYLNKKDIFYIMKASSIVIKNRSSNLLYVFKNKLVKRINNIDKTGYMKAFVLGDKSSLDNYDEYQNIGVAHLFAISGMHIGFLSFIVLKLFKNFKYNYILLDFLLVFYGFIVLFPASIRRTILFLFLKQLNKKLDFNISNLKLLFLTCFILIIFDIKIIGEISFIYSFVCVFSLIYANDKLILNNIFFNIFKSSFIVAIFSLPITLIYFYEFNFLSVIYNVFYIPFVSLILYPLTILTFIFPFLSSFLEMIVGWLEALTNCLSKIELFKIYMSINLLELLIYYLFLFLAFTRSFKYFFVLIISVFIIKYLYLLDNSIEVYFFDVGQGDSSLLITPYHKEVIMIDTGGNSNNKDYHVSDYIISFLKSKGINKIDTVIITHGDYDHMGESINLVNNFKVEKVIFNCGEYNDLEKELIKVLGKKKIPYYSCIKELNVDDNKLSFYKQKNMTMRTIIVMLFILNLMVINLCLLEMLQLLLKKKY